MAAHLVLTLLGPLGVQLDGRPPGTFEYNKVRALLAYLAVETERPHTRASLCALLWPDLPENAARQNLSQSLTQLRNVLGDRQAEIPFLLTSTETIQLNPAAHWEVDATCFMALIAETEAHAHHAWHLCTPCAAKLREIVRLYQGDFLAHFYLSDSAPFEEWALLRREQLRQRMLSALERLARYAEWHGNYMEAIDCARRQVDLEPLRDGAQRQLIRLLALSGQLGAALAQYDYFRRTLALELDAEPEPETTALWQQVRAGDIATLRQYQPPPGHLPASPSALVGRAADLEQIYELLQGPAEYSRAVTITGAPGIGKTRLALEVSTRLRYDFADGVYFIELAPVDDAALVPTAVAQVLEIKEQAGKTPAATLIARLREKHLLLILDNFEHVMEAASFVGELLAACPAVKVLVTSRAPLHIRAEQQHALAPLSPAEAIQLFTERAQAVRPNFVINQDEQAHIAALCDQLDRLPLAIELIAVRVRALSPTALVGELERGLGALAYGSRDLPERQRTLSRAIAWSYGRLSPNEQRLFAHLGLFANGGTLEAIQAVVGEEEPVLPSLERLVEVSLVQLQTAAGETRFSLLKTLGEYALEQLRARGEAEDASARHAAYIRQLADAAYEQLLGPDQIRWSARIAAELGNIRGALRWARQRNMIETTLSIATGVFRFCWQRGLMYEALSWFEQAFNQQQCVAPDLQSRAFRAAGILAWGLNDYSRARGWMGDAIATGREAGDAYAVAAATTNLGLVLKDQGEWELAQAHLSEAIALNLALKDKPHAVKFPQVVLAGLLVRLGQFAAAEQLYKASLQHNRQLGDLEGTANSLYGLAAVAAARGNFGLARQLGEESLELYGSLNHQVGTGWANYWLGNILRDAGDFGEALRHYRRSLQICLERQDVVSASAVLEDLGFLRASQHHWQPAAQTLGAAAGLREEARARLTPYEESRQEQVIAACRAALGVTSFDESWATGRAMTLAQAADLALPES